VTRNLNNLEQDDLSQTFIEKYNETQAQHPDWTTDQIVETISQDFSFPRPKPAQTRQALQSGSSNYSSNRRPRPASFENVEDASPVLAEGEQDEASEVSRRGRRMNIVRADTLLSMFKEAQEKGTTNKGSTDDDKK